MSLAVTFITAIIITAIIRKPLKRYPVVFYAIAVVFCVAGIYLTWHPHPSTIVRAVVFVIQKGQLGFSFFAIVMFIGVLDKKSAIRRSFTPVRAELSIIASILILGHLVPYAINYLSASILSLRLTILMSLTAALLLTILLLVLTVTSFNFIKRQIAAERWKTIQRFSYLFFGLIFLHLLGYMLIPVLNGSFEALFKVGTYFVIFTAYLILRLRRASLDKRGVEIETT
jgi:DMSO/TMAO reductase YedYZ heme-binding membrane subunit